MSDDREERIARAFERMAEAFERFVEAELPLIAAAKAAHEAAHERYRYLNKDNEAAK